MREMGFSYDPSVTGSGVRFDPPNERDVVSFAHFIFSFAAAEKAFIFLKSITFHRRK
jgi:hypothetical protein